LSARILGTEQEPCCRKEDASRLSRHVLAGSVPIRRNPNPNRNPKPNFGESGFGESGRHRFRDTVHERGNGGPRDGGLRVMPG